MQVPVGDGPGDLGSEHPCLARGPPTTWPCLPQLHAPLTALALCVVAKETSRQLDLENLPVKGDADANVRDIKAHGRAGLGRHCHAVFAEALGHPCLVEQNLEHRVGKSEGGCPLGLASCPLP